MNNFILGVLTCALLSFTSIETELITVKPATPKFTAIFYGYSSTYKIGELENKIKEYAQKGYILKQMSAGENEKILVVMEKY